MAELITRKMRWCFLSNGNKYGDLHTNPTYVILLSFCFLFFLNSAVAEITTGYTESFEAATMPTGWVTSNTAEYPWMIDSTKASDGTYSLRSGVMPAGGLTGWSAIEFTDNFTGGHLLVFDVFYTPTRLAANFIVNLDGKQKIILFEGDATTNWRTYAVHIPPGKSHTVQFKNYIREGDASAAWVDNLRFVDTAPLATTPGNLLVVSRDDTSPSRPNILYEYDTNGQLVWEVTLVDGARTGDVVFTGQQQIAIARHTASGANTTINLEMIDPKTMNTTSLSMDPVLQCCGSDSGSLAILDNRVFAPSRDTNYLGGIVTLDLVSAVTEMYYAPQAYRHVSIGLDNKLYALRVDSVVVDVIEPATMALLESISLPPLSTINYYAVTANANGDLFVVHDGDIEKMTADANRVFSVVNTLSTLHTFSDIDININGKIVAAGSGSAVLITDESFSTNVQFYADNDQYGTATKVGFVKITIIDADGDGMPDSWEDVNGLNSAINDALLDLDGDLLVNIDEYLANSNPQNSDTDGDTLTDGAEVHTYKTSPILGDTDGDGLLDGTEITLTTNPLIPDTDNDGLTDGAEVNTYGSNPLLPDTDGDGLSDGDEVNQFGTSPTLADTDGDGAPDKWELDNNLDPLDPADGAFDPDSDGLTNTEEFIAGTDIAKADTDSDGLKDGEEVKTYFTQPLIADTDGDGIKDGLEVLAGLNPLIGGDAALDSDGDGLTNIDELARGTDFNNSDTDQDGLNDGAEVTLHMTNPLNADSDGDGLNDGAEVNTHGTYPNNADSDADGLSDGAEVSTYATNPLLADTDSDGLTDGEEVNTYLTLPTNPDTDNDGMSDGDEIAAGRNPLDPSDGTVVVTDSDNDGMPDAWETTYGFDPQNSADATLDADGDGVSNLAEFLASTNPIDTDSDKDGMDNAWEIANGLNHEDSADATLDMDTDGVTNLGEFQAGTNPNNSDTDQDGLPDRWEIDNNLNPVANTDASLDGDSDGASNLVEFQSGTNPNNSDTDQDGMPDGWEIDHSLNPIDLSDASQDPDGDGKTNLQEFNNNTDPNISDLVQDKPGDTSSDGGGGALGPIYLLLIALYGWLSISRRKISR